MKGRNNKLNFKHFFQNQCKSNVSCKDSDSAAGVSAYSGYWVIDTTVTSTWPKIVKEMFWRKEFWVIILILLQFCLCYTIYIVATLSGTLSNK